MRIDADFVRSDECRLEHVQQLQNSVPKDQIAVSAKRAKPVQSLVSRLGIIYED
jgi:hypothetical protein